MKLKSVLKSLSEDKLREILSFWEIQVPPVDAKLSKEKKLDEIIGYLYPRFQNQQLFELAFNRLPEDEKEFFYFLLIHGGDLSKEECLTRFCADDEAKFDDYLERLSSKGFVFAEPGSDKELGTLIVGIPEPFLRFVELPSHWEGYLGYFLKDLSFSQIKSIMQVGLKQRVTTYKKNYLIYQIRQFLLEPETLRKYIESLPDNEKRIFKILLKEENGISVYRELLERGSQKRYDHAKADYINNLISFSGLVFVAVPNQNKYNSLLMVPRDVYYIIKYKFKKPDERSLKELDTVTLPGLRKPPQIILENSNNLLRDVVIFGSYVSRNSIRALSTGGIGKNDLRKIIPLMSSYKTLKYASLLALFFIMKRFIVQVGGVWRVSDRFEQWLKDSRQCYIDLYKFWLDTTEWNEEFIDGNVIHGEAKPTSLINIAELRKLVLKELENIPHNRWIHFGSFVDSLLPKIEIHLPRRSSKFLTEKYNRSNYLVVESVVSESLYWLGLVALGLDNYRMLKKLGTRTDEITETAPGRRAQKEASGKLKKTEELKFFFKLTELGHFVFKQSYLEPEKLFTDKSEDEFLPLSYKAQHFTVQPNLEVITPPDLNLHTFYLLNRFADIKTLDVMSTLTIGRESVREGMDKGLKGENVLAFLEECAQPSVPDTVKHLIAECAEKHGEIDIGYAGGYMVVDDPILLEELKSSKLFHGIIKDIIDGKVIMFKPNVDIKKFAREMQRLGFMPRLEPEALQKTSMGNYYLSLTKNDLYYLIALLKFQTMIEKELGAEVTENKATSLLERLRSDSSEFSKINFMADTISQNFLKAFLNSIKRKTDKVTSRYKKQISRLMTASMARTPSKYTFAGPNPATKLSDIKKMIEFAIENEMELKLFYKQTTDEDTAEEIIEPESMDRSKVYGFSEKKDSYGVYRLNRVKKVELI